MVLEKTLEPTPWLVLLGWDLAPSLEVSQQVFLEACRVLGPMKRVQEKEDFGTAGGAKSIPQCLAIPGVSTHASFFLINGLF